MWFSSYIYYMYWFTFTYIVIVYNCANSSITLHKINNNGNGYSVYISVQCILFFQFFFFLFGLCCYYFLSISFDSCVQLVSVYILWSSENMLMCLMQTWMSVNETNFSEKEATVTLLSVYYDQCKRWWWHCMLLLYQFFFLIWKKGFFVRYIFSFRCSLYIFSILCIVFVVIFVCRSFFFVGLFSYLSLILQLLRLCFMAHQTLCMNVYWYWCWWYYLYI